MAEWFSRFEEMGEGVSEFVSGWFLGTPISAIRRDNAIEFLAWAMYTSEVDALSADERKKLMETLAVIEEYLPHKFEPGRNPEARCIRHTLSPVVPFSHLPLAVYLGLGLLRVVARGILAVNGFRREVAPCGKFCYWYRGVKRGGERARPVVFLHGICSSILWYLEMIWKLSRGKACVVVELSPIAMHLSVFRACALPSEDEMVASIESIMSRHRIRRAAFVAHSFGSIAVAWVARRRPELVSQIGLMDPVSLLLFMPNVAKAFLHPETMEDSIIKRALLIISREKGVSYTLHRHFWWYTNILWPEDIRCPMVVSLAGLDRIVPTKAIRRMLLSYPHFASFTAAKAPESSRQADPRGQDNGQSRSQHGIDGEVTTCLSDPGLTVVASSTGSSVNVPDNNGGKVHVVGSTRQGCRRVSIRDSIELLFWPTFSHGGQMFCSEALQLFVETLNQQAEAHGLC